MNFAVNVPTSVGEKATTDLVFADGISWEDQRDIGVEVDELGFAGVAVPDHLATGGGATEALTTLAGLAAETEDVCTPRRSTTRSVTPQRS